MRARQHSLGNARVTAALQADHRGIIMIGGEKVLKGEKVLITGATGKIAFPIARALARENEVWRRSSPKG